MFWNLPITLITMFACEVYLIKFMVSLISIFLYHITYVCMKNEACMSSTTIIFYPFVPLYPLGVWATQQELVWLPSYKPPPPRVSENAPWIYSLLPSKLNLEALIAKPKILP